MMLDIDTYVWHADSKPVWFEHDKTQIDVESR